LVEKPELDEWKAAAQARGVSLTALIRQAMAEKLSREASKSGQDGADGSADGQRSGMGAESST
jgi:hypothetical protein